MSAVRHEPGKNIPDKTVPPVLRTFGSGKLALVLVALVILFSLAGALLPQEGMFDAREIAAWQENHPSISSFLRPLGLFHVFHSLPFLIIIFLLTVNTLICTVIHLVDQGGISALLKNKSLRTWGFVLLHISLIGLFIGGGVSVGFRLDGYIILTEGQTFTEQHSQYLRLAEGPVRAERHIGFEVTLKEVKTAFNKDKPGIPMDITSMLQFNAQDKPVEVKINYPYSYRGMAFTQDETGYSPRLKISDENTGQLIIHTFAALKTFKNGTIREYRDFLPLPPLIDKKQQLILTFFPDFIRREGKLIKTGDQPGEPLLLAELQDTREHILARAEMKLNETANVGDFMLTFTGFRRWSSFRVVDDPGYNIVWISLFLCVVGIVIRYIPDLHGWFSESPR